jgi:NSS family neurotransmitter:Na+ symporter
MERERLGSRLGFILLSAGCAIGIGNVWRFPYVAGRYGGGAFVLFYLFFLIIMGLPVMTMEFAVGRASKKSIIKSFAQLEKEGTKWHLHGYAGLVGNYCLMMFYTTVAGWMLYYFYLMLTGRFTGADAAAVGQIFGDMLAKPGVMAGLMLLVVAVGFGICSVGLQSGVERMTKGMMVALLGIMLLLAFHSVTMEGGAEGISFYLKPDFERMMEVGIGETMVGAMNQAFFTLSLGIGSMAIFGSYIGKEHALLKESVNIAVLDTCVAVVAGLIIFPACFSFGINPDSGPSLIFVTLPNVFNSMAGGRVWGTLFFVFMSFAAFSTVLAVFENIISCCMDMWGISRKKACLINFILLGLLSLPCVLGFNLWSGFMPFGEGSNVLDLEDFIVSNLMLPIGSFIYLLFCVSKIGWGFDNYLKEANTGKGMKVPRFLKPYLQFILPAMILFIFIKGIIDKF